MCVARNVMQEPSLCPGGGATEMALSVLLAEKGKGIGGVQQWPYRALAEAFEVIPRTLVQNCGGNAIRTLTQLKVRPKSFHFLFCYLLKGKTRQWRTYLGYRRNHWENCRYERIWSLGAVRR